MADKTNPNFYAIIPANVRYDKNLKANAKLLYGEITALCNEKGYCWANNQYFSKLYDVSKTTISLWIKDLVNNGYISSEIIYKEGSKEIKGRYLRIVTDPTQEKLNTPTQEKLKDSTTSLNTTINTTLYKQRESDFEEWWDIYGKKVDKSKAKAVFNRRYKEDGYDKIKEGTLVYLKTVTNKQYQKNPQTFLNARSYNDIEGYSELAEELNQKPAENKGYNIDEI